MKKLKGIALVFIGLFATVTLLSLLIPNKVVIAKSVTVQADSLLLFNKICDLQNWKNWHPVFMDSTVKKTYSTLPNAENSFVTWTTNGHQNKLVITKKQYPFVEMALKREGENDVENIFSIMPIQEQGNMQVQWQTITKLKWYPWEKFSGIFIEKMAGEGYEAALQSLKKSIEN
ncbi:MAG: hypothetical protein ABL929_07665 [Ferruginibacter sp.]|nr:hypothetical protein [Ferruginibacter sp.]